MSHSADRRYQVFVSSTFKDLEHERQKVLQAILEMRAFPAGMELFPSADDEQWEFIKREIESSDYYVVIVAGKYGSLAPSGISFTEMEYDFAVAQGKPVMGFLFHDLGELRGNVLETMPDRRAKLDSFREKVARGKLIKKYKSEDDLKAQVIQALAHSFQFRPAQGWLRAENARRIEDLEQINKLQGRVLTLELENSALRQALKDPSESLAQGQDVAEWDISGTVGFPPGIPGAMFPGAHPRSVSALFRVTWDELLQLCFAGRHLEVADMHLSNLLRARLQTILFPTSNSVSLTSKSFEGDGWTEVHTFFTSGSGATLVPKVADISQSAVTLNMRSVVNEQCVVRILGEAALQFGAIRLIEVSYFEGNFRWKLTVAGMARLSTLQGRTRPHVTEG